MLAAIQKILEDIVVALEKFGKAVEKTVATFLTGFLEFLEKLYE